MLPQLASGGGTPMPRKDSAASSSSTFPTLNVAEDHSPRARAERAGGGDEIALPEGEHFRPHQPAGAEPRGETDGDDQRREGETVPQGDSHEEDEDAGQGESHVHAAHQNGVNPPAIVTGGGADQCAEGCRHERAKRADAERHPGSVDDAAPDVAAQRVGTHEKGPRRRLIREVHDVDLPVRLERGDQRCGQGDDDQKCENAEAPGGRADPEKPPPRAPPLLQSQGAMAQHADHFRRDDERDEQREPVAERHTVAISTSAPAWTRNRGSAMPSKMSASRLPARTTVLAIKALAVTSG